jgi:hypothetical protein
LQTQNGKPLFSARDVVSFLECAHAATLALQDLETPLPRAEDDLESSESLADPALEHSLDYLFVDEAGQVSLANLVASGTAAKNLVLLGDQMHSDIRYLSANRIGPRKSFAPYLKSVREEESKKLGGTKLSDRKYKIGYLP